ncbi:hypothetical protein NQZ68_020396 [Dissostichus eleginoides]|nr:hypothetical protein NQZ68_020396 [Dissostichus eleginoides]
MSNLKQRSAGRIDWGCERNEKLKTQFVDMTDAKAAILIRTTGNTMVVLTSRERMDQDQLTPKYPIKHKGITSVFMKGSQFTLRTALPLACTTCKVCGWMED